MRFVFNRDVRLSVADELKKLAWQLPVIAIFLGWHHVHQLKSTEIAGIIFVAWWLELQVIAHFLIGVEQDLPVDDVESSSASE